MEFQVFKEFLSMGADGSLMIIMFILWRVSTRLTVVETKLEMQIGASK